MDESLTIAGWKLKGWRRGSRKRRMSSRLFTAALCLLLSLLTLAACNQGVTPTASGSRSPTSGSQDSVVVTIESVADSVTGGNPLQFRVSANPAPRTHLTVKVTIASTGCDLAKSSESVKIGAGKTSAPLTVPTDGVAVAASDCAVTATVEPGDGYQVGAADGASASVTLTPAQPVVTVAADAASVTEGTPVSFTLTASPPPASDLVVSVSWSDPSSFLASTPSRAVTIRASTPTAPLTAATVDRRTGEQDGSVTVTVEAGSGYTVGSSASATVNVARTASPGGVGPAPPPSSSVPLATIRAIGSPVPEGEKATFRLNVTPNPGASITVNLTWNPTAPLSSPPTMVVVPEFPSSHTVAYKEFSVTTAEVAESVRVTVTIDDGSGYEPNPDTDFSSTSFLIRDDE